MTWHSLTRIEADMCRITVQWISIVRSENYPDNWLPTDADMAKSALFERLRGGLEPLPRPPPCGMSCPWYALVEDAGPHYAGSGYFAPLFSDKDSLIGENRVSVFQNTYDILSREADGSFLLADAFHLPRTPWTFRLFYNDEWGMPGRQERGGWFIRNTEFEQKAEIPVISDSGS